MINSTSPANKILLGLLFLGITALSNAQGKSIYYPDFHSSEIMQSNTYVTREHTGSLIAVDLETGERTLLSGAGKGNGPEFKRPNFFLDQPNNRLIVWDWFLKQLLSVELSSGDSTLIPFKHDGYTTLQLSDDTGRAISLTSDRESLHVYDVPSRERYGVPININLKLEGYMDVEATRWTMDEENDRVILFVRDNFEEVSIYASDVKTGKLTVVSRWDRGEGPKLSNLIGDMRIDSQNNQLYLVDGGLKGIYRVDLATGDRTELSGRNRGEGPVLQLPRTIVLDVANNRLFVTTLFFHHVFSVDLETGARKLVSTMSQRNSLLDEDAGNSMAMDGVLDRFANRLIFSNIRLEQR